MLFTVIPFAVLQKMDGESMRVVAQIVSGVGFLALERYSTAILAMLQALQPPHGFGSPLRLES